MYDVSPLLVVLPVDDSPVDTVTVSSVAVEDADEEVPPPDAMSAVDDPPPRAEPVDAVL